MSEPSSWGPEQYRATVEQRRQQERARNAARRRMLVRQEQRRRLIIISASGTVVVVFVLGLVWLGTQPTMSTASLADTVLMDVSSQRPSPGFEAEPVPIGRPPLGASTEDHASYRFIERQVHEDGPVAWDPCRPIHYVVNPATAPKGGDVLLRKAIAAVSAATGLQFIDDGETDESRSFLRESFQQRAYGDRWAPVLIQWTDGSDFAAGLEGSIIGRAGGTPVTGLTGGPMVYVSGVVALDGPQMEDLMHSDDLGPAAARSVIMHELGHLVGLDHVEDPTQIMYPTTQFGVSTFGEGDLTGLRALSRGQCAPDL